MHPIRVKAGYLEEGAFLEGESGNQEVTGEYVAGVQVDGVGSPDHGSSIRWRGGGEKPHGQGADLDILRLQRGTRRYSSAGDQNPP